MGDPFERFTNNLLEPASETVCQHNACHTVSVQPSGSRTAVPTTAASE